MKGCLCHRFVSDCKNSAPLLQSLHWLPVDKRIVYKLRVLMFDVKYGSTPAYLAEL